MLTTKKQLLLVVVITAMTIHTARAWRRPFTIHDQLMFEADRAFRTMDRAFHHGFASTQRNLNNQSNLIKHAIVEEGDKSFLHVEVDGIARSEDAPKEALKKDNSISITTEIGSVSIEQRGSRVIFDASSSEKIDRDGFMSHHQRQEQFTKEFSGTIKFDQAKDFQVLPKNGTQNARIVMRLPIEDYKKPASKAEQNIASQPVPKTYTFSTQEPALAKAVEVPQAPAVDQK